MARPKSERNIRAAEYMRQNPEATLQEVKDKFGYRDIKDVYGVRLRYGLHVPEPRSNKRPRPQPAVVVPVADPLQLEKEALLHKVAIIEQEQERRRNKEQAERKKEEEMRRKEITYEVLDDEHVAIQIGGETHVMHFQGAYNFVRFGHCAKLRDFLKANFPMGGQYQ